jgi:hypothetical protein
LEYDAEHLRSEKYMNLAFNVSPTIAGMSGINSAECVAKDAENKFTELNIAFNCQFKCSDKTSPFANGCHLAIQLESLVQLLSNGEVSPAYSH